MPSPVPLVIPRKPQRYTDRDLDTDFRSIERWANTLGLNQAAPAFNSFNYGSTFTNTVTITSALTFFASFEIVHGGLTKGASVCTNIVFFNLSLYLTTYAVYNFGMFLFVGPGQGQYVTQDARSYVGTNLPVPGGGAYTQQYNNSFPLTNLPRDGFLNIYLTATPSLGVAGNTASYGLEPA